MAVPGVEDHEKLAWEVWASFWLPKRTSKLHEVENYHQALPALLCLLWKNFLPLPDSIFAYRDIPEMQCKKMVAYAWALQFWAVKVDLPTGGRPHLLAESVKELWEEMRCYLSFLDEEVFKGVVLPEETSAVPAEKANTQSAGQHLPVPLGRKLLQGWPGNLLWKRGPWINSLVGRRCYIHPNPWWLLGRSPICWEVQDWGFVTGLNPLNWRTEGDDHPTGNPLAYTRVRSCPVNNTASWFSQSDGMSKEGPVTRKGPWGIPRPIDGRSYVGPCGGDHECMLHCEGWGDRGHLHGHGNHLCWESGPQWPWTGDLSPGAQDTRHNRPHLRSSQITAFGQWGKPTTTVEQINCI